MKHNYKTMLKQGVVLMVLWISTLFALQAQPAPFYETFDGAFPTGWRQVDNSGGVPNSWSITAGHPFGLNPINAYQGSHNISLFATDTNFSFAYVRLISKKIDLSGFYNPKISFWAYISAGSMNQLNVYYNVDDDTSSIGSGFPLEAFALWDTANTGWTYFEAYLDETAANNSHVYLCFEGMVENSGVVLIDELKIEEGVPQCSASFSWQNQTGNLVTFYNNSTSMAPQPDYHFAWDFGDGYNIGDIGLVDTTHLYEYGGFFTVTLNMYEYNTGCSDDTSINIAVGNTGGSCLADFDYTYNQNDSSFTFYSTSLGLVNNYYWTLGDGTIKTDSAFNHEYNVEGMYNVTLSIGNDSGCTSTYYEDVIYGNPACIARFTYNYNEADSMVYFYDNSISNTGPMGIDGWYWNFGDGYTSYEPYPIHRYATSGFYNVSLTVTNSTAGYSDTYTKLIAAGSNLCNADFNYVVNAATRNVAFTAVTAPTITNYFWDFGDGTFSNEKNPTHQYAEDGLYYVSLSVDEGFNGQCWNWVNKEVQVGTLECYADFSYSNPQGTNTVIFVNETYGNPTHIYWDFGDGSFSDEFNPTHTYPAGGFYYVSLVIWNDNNQCFDYAWDYITVGDPGVNCVAKFNYFNNVSTKTVTFTNTSIGSIGDVWWDFGDGGYSQDMNPTHTYENNGYYDVCLYISTTTGLCFDFIWKRVPAGDVSNIPLANFVYTVDTNTNTVAFNNTSYKDNQYRYWDFGDGYYSEDKHPTHTYMQQGLYLVYLAIWNDLGHYSDKWDLINVSPNTGLQGDFGYRQDTTGGKAAGSVEFRGAAYGDPSRCVWSFGDGTYDSVQMNPVHVFADEGWYNVCFTVTNSNTGQTSTTCKTIYVGIQENQTQDFMLRIAPNPVKSMASIAYVLPQAMNVKIAITDVLGNIKVQPVNEKQHSGLHSFTLNTSELSSGTYILQLVTDKGVQYQKFIISR